MRGTSPRDIRRSVIQPVRPAAERRPAEGTASQRLVKLSVGLLHIPLHTAPSKPHIPIMSDHDPFAGRSPAEVPLDRAPLIRVLAAVRFPRILSIETPAFIAPFQEALRAKYPVLRSEKIRSIVIGPEGPEAPEEGVVWRFSDLSG